MTGPVAKAEAWVRVVPSTAVVAGKQADALVAGTRKFDFLFVWTGRESLSPCGGYEILTYWCSLHNSGSHWTVQQRQGLGHLCEELCDWH